MQGRKKYKIKKSSTQFLFQDLKKTDIMMGKVDPYVMVHLLPGSHEVGKTKVMKKSYDPEFNETFTFPISVTDVVSKTVVLQVVDKDMISKDDVIGEVQVHLWEMDLYGVKDSWSELHAPTGKFGHPSILKQRPVTNGRKKSKSSSSDSSSDSASSSDEDVADGQNLTLKQLNNLLLRYIDQVRDMDHNMGSTYTTSIDR